MLAALEHGVKGGKWFSLIDKVYSLDNVFAAVDKVHSNQGAPGVDHVTVEMFVKDLEANVSKLHKSLREGTYHPQAIRRKWIPKPGSTEERPLGIPTVRDRVAQTALRNVVEPIFERDFAAHSYGFRPGRGCKDALRRVEALMKQGYAHIVDADLKRYFDTIPREALLERIKEKISDGRVLELIAAYLNQGVLEDLKEWTPEKGTPQGAVISPLLANIYLDPLDHLIAEAGFEMVRYADDFVVLCRSREEANKALQRIAAWTREAGLTLHPEKTQVVHAVTEGFTFLGYHFKRGTRRPRKKSLKKLKDTIRTKTKRTNGQSLSVTIEDLNRVLVGWFGYYKHSHKSTFGPLDKWIRMRLRSILRKRSGRKGRGSGLDHLRWTNAYFAAQGLFSLKLASEIARQSAMR
jgi:RNA-directed DNA polymerase